MVMLGRGTSSPGTADLHLTDRLFEYINGGRLPASEPALLNRVKEGPVINTTVTAPAALVAVALTYIRTGDRHIIQKLCIPKSQASYDNNVD